MGRFARRARVGAVAVGASALLAASALPGAASIADLGAPFASVTRAVLTQANADATEVTRSSLITQIQVDGQGELNINVPVAEGAAPKNMDTFGGPSVVDGDAVYDLAVDGANTVRTLQPYDPADIPVGLTITARLDGRPISPTELTGVTGLVELTYTAKNLTSTPTSLTYKDGSGKTVREQVDLPTAMGGTLDIIFPPEWTEITSEDATVISGDGSGSTQFSAGYTLFPPFGEVTGSVRIEARVDNGDMPPAVLKFTVLQPEQNPTARSIAGQLGTGVETGEAIYDAGTQLGAGALELKDGLEVAASGAGEIAAGVANTLVPGVNELNSGVQNSLVPGVNELNSGVQNSLVPGVNELNSGVQNTLAPGSAQVSGGANQLWTAFSSSAQNAQNTAVDLVNQVRAQQSYQDLLAGFDKLNSATALFKIQGTLQKVIAALGSPFDVPPNAELADQTANSAISALIWGVPSASLTGLTNPDCVPGNAAATGCGAVQVLDILLNQLSYEVPNPACVTTLANCSSAPAPGGAAILDGLPSILFGDTGWGTPLFGQDVFGAGGALQNRSVKNTLEGSLTAYNATYNPGGDCAFTQVAPGQYAITGASDATCPIRYNSVQPVKPLGDALTGSYNLAFIGSNLSSGLQAAVGTGSQVNGSDSGGTSARYALGQIRGGLVSFGASRGGIKTLSAADYAQPYGTGYPSGCAGDPRAFADSYDCGYSPAAAALELDTKLDLSGALLALGVQLGKGPVTTTEASNPTLQISSTFPLYGDAGPFGVCPGPQADAALVEAHCSAAQILSFTAAGISGTPNLGFAQTTGLVPPDTTSDATPWSDPVYGAISPGCVTIPNSWPPAIPGAPDSATQVEPFGVSCAVRVLQQSLDRILVPTIGVNVQAQTLASLGNGVYNPNCDSATDPTLTCGLSLIRFGTNELNSGIQDTLAPGTAALAAGVVPLANGTAQLAAGVGPLADGTAQLAAGLPAAVDGAGQIVTDAAEPLQEQGNEAAASFARQVALYDTMNDQMYVDKYIPGGAPTGDNIRYNGVYAFELSGTGSGGTRPGINFALAALALAAAAGVGGVLASRASGAR